MFYKNEIVYNMYVLYMYVYVLCILCVFVYMQTQFEQI